MQKAVNCLVNLFEGISKFEITLLHVVQEMVVYAENGIYDFNNKIGDDAESDDLLGEFKEEFLRHKINVKKVVKKGSNADVIDRICK